MTANLLVISPWSSWSLVLGPWSLVGAAAPARRPGAFLSASSRAAGLVSPRQRTKDQGLRTNPPGPAFGLLLEAFEPPCFAAAQALFRVGSRGPVGIGRT